MNKFVDLIIKNCQVCQTKAQRKDLNLKTPIQEFPYGNRPGKIVHLDVKDIGYSESGNRYVLFVQENALVIFQYVRKTEFLPNKSKQ